MAILSTGYQRLSTAIVNTIVALSTLFLFNYRNGYLVHLKL